MKIYYVLAFSVALATPAFAQSVSLPEPPIPYQLDEALPLEPQSLQPALQQQQTEFDQQRQFDYNMEVQQQQQQANSPYWQTH